MTSNVIYRIRSEVHKLERETSSHIELFSMENESVNLKYNVQIKKYIQDYKTFLEKEQIKLYDELVCLFTYRSLFDLWLRIIIWIHAKDITIKYFFSFWSHFAVILNDLKPPPNRIPAIVSCIHSSIQQICDQSVTYTPTICQYKPPTIVKVVDINA